MKPNFYILLGIVFLILTWLFTGLFRDDDKKTKIAKIENSMTGRKTTANCNQNMKSLPVLS
jgi:hypothetical protein